MKMLHERTLGIALVTVAGMSLLAGCSTGGGAKPAEAGAVNCDQASIAEKLAQYAAEPEFVAPGPAFDASQAQGKTVINIPLTSTLPYNQDIDAAMARAAEAAGVKFIQYSNQGSPAEWIQGIQSGIAQRVDAIILEGSPDPKLLGPQIAEAQAAGIPVISTHLFDVSQVEEALSSDLGLSAIMPAHHNRAGELMADYIINASACDVNALFVTADDVSASQGIEDSFVAELGSVCAETCSAKVVNVPIASWGQNIPGEVQSALTANPKINWVVPVYAGGMQGVLSGVRQANATDRVRSVSYGGTASTNQMIQDGDVIVAQVGESPEWNGWANMDVALRLLSGVDLLEDENVPQRILDTENVDETGTPPVEGAGYGPASAYEDGYLELWGLAP
jgi:ribose transport system substrate-binding protein